MDVWLNGRFVPAEQATVSVFDAGLQHGVGLFETMHARNGRVFRVDDHLRRLQDSARTLMLSTRLRTGPLAEAVALTVTHNAMDAARVRLTITGGNLNMLQASGREQQDPTILIVAQPPTPYPDEFFTDGVRVAIADGRANPLSPMAGHKTLDYWPRIHALRQTAKSGAGEALWFSVSNHLVCGSVSNVFLVKEGGLLTPFARGEEVPGALPSPVLPGITRKAVIECAEAAGIAIGRRMLDIEALLGADEVFLTNSSWGVLPVVGVERESIADGKVGPVTSRLRADWLATVEAETAGPG